MFQVWGKVHVRVIDGNYDALDEEIIDVEFMILNS
jgi:hypothetical protein